MVKAQPYSTQWAAGSARTKLHTVRWQLQGNISSTALERSKSNPNIAVYQNCRLPLLVETDQTLRGRGSILEVHTVKDFPLFYVVIVCELGATFFIHPHILIPSRMRAYHYNMATSNIRKQTICALCPHTQTGPIQRKKSLKTVIWLNSQFSW